MIRQFFQRRHRERRALECLAARSAAKDALRRAIVRRDTRSIHDANETLKAANTALLAAEVALDRVTKKRV
jgi:hypothetical protein